MNSAMKHLKPYFQNGEIRRKGVFIIGTVQGDLHDIGKNLTGMMVEGAGWEVIDLGTDVSAEKYIQEKHPGTKVIVGGAPLNAEFARQIGADAYGRDPQDDINWLDSIVA